MQTTPNSPKTSSRQSFFKLDRISLGAAIALIGICPASAANLYWDPSGGPSATGTWGSGNSNWNSASNGTGTFTDTTTASDALTFSASPVTTAGTITVNGTQAANSITINQSGLTLTGGTITAATFIMNAATTASIESVLALTGITLTFNGGSAQTLTLSGGQSGLAQVVGGSTAKALASTLIMNGSGTTNYQFSQYNIGNANAGTGGAVLNTGAMISYGISNTISIGNDTNKTGLLTVSGGTIGNDTTTNISVGRNSGTGRLILNSGSINLGTGRVLNIGQTDSAGGSGRVDVNGGTMTVAGTLNIGISQTGSAGTAALNITGGTSSVGTISFGSSSTAGTSSLTLTGGTLYVGSGGMVSAGTGSFSSSISLSGGTVGASANWSSGMNMALGTTNGNVTFRAADSGGTARNISLSGALSGNGGMTKTGGGTLTLSGTNTFTGDTVVNAGSLVLSSGSEIRFVIQDGGTSNSLSGAGMLTANGIFRLDISGLTDTTGTWTLVDVGSLTESFGATFNLSFLGGSTFTNNNDGTYTNGNWTFSTVTGDLSVVPEPSTMATALLGLGAAVLLCHRRKRVA